MVESVINRSLIVNDEPTDGTTQLGVGEEAVDGDSNAVITVVRSTLAPTASDIRPRGQLWLRTTNQALYWSRGDGTWFQVRDVASSTSRYEVSLGNGVLTSFTVVHNRNNERCAVEVWEASGLKRKVMPRVQTIDANTITVTFLTGAPATNSYVVVVIG